METTEQTNTTTETQPQAAEQVTQQEPQSNSPSVLFEEQGAPVENVEEAKQPQQAISSQTLTAEDIKIPDGFEYDKELGDSFLGILNEAGISKDTAQKLFDLYQSQNVKLLDGLKAADLESKKKFETELATEKAEWLKQCQADKEYGGQAWDANQSVIERAAREFTGAVQVMQAYNLNTHPEIVRMFYRAGKLMSEDNSQISGNGAGKEIDPAIAIFGNSLKEWHKRKDGKI